MLITNADEGETET